MLALSRYFYFIIIYKQQTQMSSFYFHVDSTKLKLKFTTLLLSLFPHSLPLLDQVILISRPIKKGNDRLCFHDRAVISLYKSLTPCTGKSKWHSIKVGINPEAKLPSPKNPTALVFF